MRILFAFIFTVLVGSLSAQTLQSLPENKGDYFKTLADALEATDKDFVKGFMETDFEPFWMSSAVTAADEKFVYEISNSILKKRLKPDPYVRYLVTAFYKLKNETQYASSYEGYKSAIRALSEARSKSNFQDYLESTGAFFETGNFFATRTSSWKLASGDMTIRYDSVPAFDFKNATLVLSTKGDSSVLTSVDARFVNTTSVIYTTKGKITWDKAGLNPATNYAEFWKEKIKAKSSFFSLDSVIMHTEMFPEPMAGKVNDKVTVNGSKEAKYPVFESNVKSLVIKDIAPGVDYKGGFALRGAQFNGLGTAENPSAMIFKYNEKPVVVAYSQDFDVDAARINSPLAKVKIVMGEDSIYHPGLSLKYNREKGILELLRNQEGISESPFFSSYHKMDFFVQKVSWKLGEPNVIFGSLAGEAINKSTFESSNFFVYARHRAMQMPGQKSPLQYLQDISDSYGMNSFNIKLFAQERNVAMTDAKRIIISLANKGFIYYDVNSETITMKQKLTDFLLAVRKQVDYDNIYFESNVKNHLEPNAVLNIENYDLDIRGVKKVNLSDSQAVAVYGSQAGDKLIVKKNRNMLFSGVVKAGNLDLYGDSLMFDYDSFSIDLGMVDSAVVNVVRLSKDSIKKYVPVRTKIMNLVGKMEIDNPENKSGLNNTDFGYYPVLTTTEPSYTYYESKDIADGTYKKEDFYFEIDPFTKDSLNDLEKETVFFEGTMVTAGIFPDIKTNLVIMDDYSLGINHTAPPEGLALYDGKAKFKNEIKMTEEGGLQGDGDIEYVTSISSSERFNFFPDSTLAVAQKITNKKQTSGPDVPSFTGGDFLFKLYKTNDYLLATSVKEHFSMFEDQAQKTGSLRLTPKDLTGRGKLSAYASDLESERFLYNNSNAFADTASFKLNSVDDAVAIQTKNVKAHIDFAYKVGNFKANNVEESKVEFPKNQYAAFMDSYKWLIEKQKMEMTSSQGAASDSTLASNLLSTHPDQDSLRFVAPKAIYDINEYILRAEQVEKIFVADAFIYPDAGKVNVLPGAQMETLQNATIEVDYINKFHTIFEASIDVLSRKKYHGKGKYDYVDEFGEKQKIAFDDISVNPEGSTFALGQIPEEQGFKLNSFFDYKGEVMLKSQEKGLSFAGSTKIKANCADIPLNWLAFKGQVDPKNAQIPVGDKMLNQEGQPLAAGLMMNLVEDEIYPAFISVKKSPKDVQLAEATGILWYDGADKSYKMGSKDRADGGTKGNVIILNTETCNLTSKGEFGFGVDLAQVNVKGYGETNYNSKSKKVTLEGSLITDFYLEKKMMEIVGQKFTEYPFLQPVNIANTPFQGAINAWLDAKEAKGVNKDLETKGLLDKVPSGLEKAFVFANVKFSWDTATASFVSNGPLQVSNIMGKQAFVTIKGKIQVLGSKRGNELGMYLELDPTQWFYYKYKNDKVNPSMKTYSSNKEYMAIFEELKENDFIVKGKKGMLDYKFEETSRTSKDAWLDRF